MNAEFTALIESDLTSERTRRILTKRMDEPTETVLFTAGERETLRALTARVIPDAGFQLASRIEKNLAAPLQDGWRFDLLPPDFYAWKQGLHSLDQVSMREYSVPFAGLDAVAQDGLLRKAQAGDVGKGILGSLHIGDSRNAFDADQMQKWFEDVRGELTKLYVADPRTMERMGFTGFADEQPFTHITLGDQQEPPR